MLFSKFIARQLSHPSRIFGNFTAWLWNKRNRVLNDAAFDCLALRPDDRVLDVGFGGGYLLGRMSSIVKKGLLAGVDVSQAMVTLFEKRYHPLVRTGKLDIQCGQAESLPFVSGHFIKVCSVNSIFYWQDVPLALSEFHRVLIDGGLLVLCFTLKSSLKNRNFAKYLHIYEVVEVEEMIKSCGFQEIELQFATDKHREFVCITARK